MQEAFQEFEGSVLGPRRYYIPGKLALGHRIQDPSIQLVVLNESILWSTSMLSKRGAQLSSKSIVRSNHTSLVATLCLRKASECDATSCCVVPHSTRACWHVAFQLCSRCLQSVVVIANNLLNYTCACRYHGTSRQQMMQQLQNSNTRAYLTATRNSQVEFIAGRMIRIFCLMSASITSSSWESS